MLKSKSGRTIRCVSFSPNNIHLAGASFDGTTTVYGPIPGGDGEGGVVYEAIGALEGHESEVKGAAWDCSGALLATCSRDKSVWIWEVTGDDFECAAVLSNHTQDVKSVCWHPSLEILVSASYDDTIKAWHCDPALDDWVCVDTLVGHTSTVWAVAFEPNRGDLLASVSDDRTVRVWNMEARSPTSQCETDRRWTCVAVLPAECHPRTIFSVAWAPSGLIATGAADNALRLLEFADGALRVVAEKLAAHEGDVNRVIWEDSDTLLSAGDDNQIKVWKVKN